jgi:hypothetical protein
MVVTTTKIGRKQAKNKGLSLLSPSRTTLRLGAMAPARNRTADAPTFQQILERYGFIPKESTAAEAWALWQRVAEDKRVIAMAQEIERPKHRMKSVTAGYLHTGSVLSTMTARQTAALKQRLGVPCATR